MIAAKHPSNRPLYSQTLNALTAMIEEGTYQHGDRLPMEGVDTVIVDGDVLMRKGVINFVDEDGLKQGISGSADFFTQTNWY